MQDAVQVAVIGAGVVGAAFAALAARHGVSVALLEEAEQEGMGITSRNSGVIHSGLYYKTGSLKARSCVRGQELLYEWCRTHSVPHRQTGKLVVAHDEHELEALEALEQKARANGAPGLAFLSPKQVASKEPGLPEVLAALYCPYSGIVDPHALTRSYCLRAADAGAMVVYHAKVLGVEQERQGFRIDTARGPLHAETVVNAAGMNSGTVASYFGVAPPRLFFCRGDYFRLNAKLRFDTLVYPVRRNDGSGLGVHLCLDVSGAMRLGPDADWVDSGDDFGPLALEREKQQRFHVVGQRLLGPFPFDALTWDGCGIRPKLARGEEMDFEIHEEPERVLHLFGLESPGLTAAPALAELLLERLGLTTGSVTNV